MHWNYRVIRQQHMTGEVTHAIHEVYYGDVDSPKGTMVTEKPVRVISTESPHQLADLLDQMRLALTKPVLDYNDDFPDPENDATPD